METQLASLVPFQGTIGNNKYAQTVAMGDINGDGIIDLIPINYNGTGGYGNSVYLGGWCPNSACSTTDANRNYNGMMLSDGMMQYSVGPLGEEVLVGYNRAPHDLQLPQYVVSWMLRADARDDQQIPYIENYSWTYSGGLYTDRKFFGFSNVTEVDPNGNTMDFTYSQTPIFAGQELSEDIRRPSNSNEFVYQKTNTWTALTGYQGALTSTTETYTDWPDPVLDGGQTSYSTITNFTYDQNLNITQRYRNPNTSQTGLDSTTVFHWASNSAEGIWSLPASVTEYSGTSTSASAILSSTTFIYDDEPFGQATRGLITSQQEAVQVTVPQKSVVRTNSYDQYGNVVAVKDRNGNTSTYEYDSQSATNRVSATDVDGNTITSTFDPRFGYALSTTDPSGNTTSYQYDAFGRISKVIKPGDSGLAGGTTNYTYSPITGTFPTGFSVLRRDSMPNQAPMTTTELYDCYGQVYKKLLYNNGKAIVATTLYDTMGYPIQMSRPYIQGTTPAYTTLTRDFLHRVTQIQDAAGNTTLRRYAGTQVTEYDPRGLTTVTTLNPWEKVISKVLPTSSGTATTQYVYDAEKQLRRVIRADGSTSTITYDLLGRKTSMTDPNTGKYTYQYDNESHLTAVTGPDGKTIRYTYTPSGSLLSRIYPDGTTNNITYGTSGQTNAVGRMVSVKDAAGTVQFAYDARGRVTQRTRYVAINKKTYVTGYAYDSADHLKTVTYPDGFQAIYAYDDLGNVASVKDSSGNLIAGSFNYSASGRLNGLAYGNGTSSSYTYDVIDRMTGLETKQAGGTLIQNLAYSYDADSNISNINDSIYTDTQQFTYDNMNRLVSATGQGYGTEAYSYDSLGNLLTKGSAAFIMDAANPEQADCMVPNTPGITTCALGGNTALPIQYDVHGNMIQVGSSQYAYDPENRLLTESTSGSVTESNIYDFWGDRVVQQTAAETRIFIDGIYEENGSIAERHVRTPNLLLATIVTSIGSTAVKTEVIKHTISTPMRYLVAAPPVGNSRPFLLASTGFSLLVILVGGCFRVSRAGGRLQVRMGVPKFFKPFRSALNLLLILCFIVSGGQEGSAEIRPTTALKPPAGAMRTVTSTFTRKTNTRIGTGEVRYYYHMNHLGGVNVVTNDAGTIVAQRQYKPYGEMYQNQGSVADSTLPFSFDGERQDGASSLYYFNARFYNPIMGRFLSADTEIRNPSVPQALNRYSFAGGNPIRYVDPSGHSWWDYLIAACIIIAIVIIAEVSGGAGAALLVVALSAVGFGVGAGIAAGLGYSPSSDSFW
jgi:RHS repeat-associated protein